MTQRSTSLRAPLSTRLVRCTLPMLAGTNMEKGACSEPHVCSAPSLSTPGERYLSEDGQTLHDLPVKITTTVNPGP